MPIVVAVSRRGEDGKGRVAALPDTAQLAFAAACAEHLLPLYRRFSQQEAWGDPSALSHGIQLVWEHVAGRGDEPQMRHAAARCEHVTPDMDDFSTGWASLALDAAAAVILAIEACLVASPTEKVLEVQELATEAAFALSQRDGGLIVIVDAATFLGQLDSAVTDSESSFQGAVVEFLESATQFDSHTIRALRGLSQTRIIAE